MKILNLTYVNLKRMTRDLAKIGTIFLMPIVVILFSYMMSSKGPAASSNVQVAFNIEDKGELGAALIEASAGSMHIYNNDREQAIERLEKNDVAVVYIIPEDFTEKVKNGEKPVIESYRREEGNITVPLEAELNSSINRLIKEQLLMHKGIIKDKDELYAYNSETVLERKDRTINMGYHMTATMITYFILLSTSSIGTELIDFKKKNILSRTITTPNSTFTVLGALILSIMLLQVGANILVLFISKIVIGFTIDNFLVILINIILSSLFSITLSMTVTRIFNNEGIASIVTVLIVIITLYLSIFAQNNIYNNVPYFISNLGKFTPQYWINDSIEKAKLLPNVFVILLMIGVLFSAGSYKFNNFVNRNR